MSTNCTKLWSVWVTVPSPDGVYVIGCLVLYLCEQHLAFFFLKMLPVIRSTQETHWNTPW